MAKFCTKYNQLCPETAVLHLKTTYGFSLQHFCVFGTGNIGDVGKSLIIHAAVSIPEEP